MTKYLGLNISDELSEAIDKRLGETRQNKTDFVTSLLNKELGSLEQSPSLSERIEWMEEQISEISDRLKVLEQVNAIAAPQSDD
jgi:hypothetical protein